MHRLFFEQPWALPNNLVKQGQMHLDLSATCGKQKNLLELYTYHKCNSTDVSIISSFNVELS